MNETAKKLHYTYKFLRKDLVHLNLQLLYKCNFKCRICDFWKEPYTGYNSLSIDQVQVISDKLKQLGPMLISIGGGEPLMHKGIIDIISILSKNNFPVMICNGWFVNPSLAKDIFKAGLYEVSISVDYANAAQHDAQRGMPGAFDRAISALETLFKNRTNPAQRVHMISVVMDDNIDQIESLIKLSKEIGVTYLVTLYSNGRGNKDYMKNVVEISKRLLTLKKKYKEFVALPGYISKFSTAQDNPNGIVPCFAGKNLFNIDSQGNVTRCIDQLEHVAGNMFIDDIYTIKTNLNKQFQMSNCGNCWTSCRGNIESIMYGQSRIKDYMAFFEMTKNIKLNNYAN